MNNVNLTVSDDETPTIPRKRPSPLTNLLPSAPSSPHDEHIPTDTLPADERHVKQIRQQTYADLEAASDHALTRQKKITKSAKLSRQQKSGATKKKTKTTLAKPLQNAKAEATKNITERKAKTTQKHDRVTRTVAKAKRRMDKDSRTAYAEPHHPGDIVYESTYNPQKIL